MDKRTHTADLRTKAASIRRDIVDVCVKNGAGHIAPSLSPVDILVALYYRVMRFPDGQAGDGRDRLVFSKAHGCYGVYAILADLGHMERKLWEQFYQQSPLHGCIERHVEHGMEASCGALGHGLPIATGIAFGARLQRKQYRVFCVVGDGELQEGSNWEAIEFAVKHDLSNLTIIVDANGLQAMDFLENILTVKGRKDDLERKLGGFGCAVKSVEGHDPCAVADVLSGWADCTKTAGPPQALIAHTVKGYGLNCMENVPKYHFRVPTEEELKMGNRYE